MADMSRALGVRIRERRRAAGYESIEAFAHALGFSWPTVSRYERGVTTPDLVRLHRIADVLGVPIEDLISEENHDPTPSNGQAAGAGSQMKGA